MTHGCGFRFIPPEGLHLDTAKDTFGSWTEPEPCYSSYARGTEFLMGYYAILDRVPRGRGEDSQAMSRLRRHDEYPGQ